MLRSLTSPHVRPHLRALPTTTTYRLRRIGRVATLATLATLATVATVATALPASAHVHVVSDDAAPGGYGVLTFRVPTESSTASTVKITVALPKDTPFPSVSVKAHPGWTTSAPKQALGRTVRAGDYNLTDAVLAVTWTAIRGGGIAPGGFDEFELSVGPFPKDAKQLVFVVDQTYSDGKVVHWNELQAAGAEEPESPAPVLKLTGAAVPAATAGAAVRSATDTTTLTIAICGLVVALIGTGLGCLALTNGRRRLHAVQAA